MLPHRLLQINANIQRELSPIIIEIAKPEWGIVTITDVQIDPNHLSARVWVNANIEAVKSLNRQASVIIQKLKPRLRLKHIPKLIFIEDKEDIDKIETLLEEINES